MNLIKILTERAKEKPDQKIYTVLPDGENTELVLTLSELEAQAKSIATELLTKFEKEDRLLLLFDTSIEFLTTFWGCLFAGIIAVPIHPPMDLRMLNRAKSIIQDTGVKAILTTSELQGKISVFKAFLGEAAKLEIIAVDKVESKSKDYIEQDIDIASKALIQYTSGTSGISKGVLLTHKNLLHNASLLQEMQVEANSFYNVEHSTLIWLPLYHDMGLISGVILPLLFDMPTVLMPPLIFLQKPFRWLKAMSKYKTKYTMAPNFAYELCNKRITNEQVKTLDLSNWQVALNGAETIRAETLERFINKFAPCGFRPETFYPAYGLAESTVFVTGGLKNAPPVFLKVNKKALEINKVEILAKDSSDSIILVGVGKTWLDQEVKIVNPETLELCKDDEIGEIWIKGDSVASEYWKNEEETKKVFNVTLSTNSKKYLRSGDLGFIDNNELYITGRIKDLIIIHGLNYYPQHIEQTVEKLHESFRAGCNAAFSIDLANEEKLIVIQEIRKDSVIDDLKKLENDVKLAITENHGVHPHEVKFIKHGSIFKTSSGKIQRRLCKKKYLEGKLELWSN